MASAKKCDICGDLYEIYNDRNNAEKVNGLMFLNIDYQGKYFSHKATDCCPECMNKIHEYIEQLRQSKTPT